LILCILILKYNKKYNLYREVYPPSCVEDAIPCHFTSPTARNLVVVKASTIEIYEVLEVTDEEEKKFWIGKDSKDQVIIQNIGL